MGCSGFSHWHSLREVRALARNLRRFRPPISRPILHGVPRRIRRRPRAHFAPVPSPEKIPGIRRSKRLLSRLRRYKNRPRLPRRKASKLPARPSSPSVSSMKTARSSSNRHRTSPSSPANRSNAIRLRKVFAICIAPARIPTSPCARTPSKAECGSISSCASSFSSIR